ncbi:MAG: Ig domain-containing protein, partial [Thermoguttaceae bacterium]
YRVVAIDGAGNESGPSDYAEVPRPQVVAPPELHAKVGQSFQFEPVVIRSIGDLRCVVSKRSSYNAAWWNREEFSFEPLDLPAGLQLDRQTGVISGTPQKPGPHQVRFNLTAPHAAPPFTATFRLVAEP